MAGVSVEKTPFIWMDGALVPWDAAQVHLLTHSLHYGLAAFEGIRCYQTLDGRSAIFRLGEHVRRLFDSARIGMMKIPLTPEQVSVGCVELLRANKMAHAYLRPLAWHSEGLMGVGSVNPVRVAVAAWHWGAYLGEEGMQKGIRAKVSSFTRGRVNAAMARGKLSGQYVNSVLAKREVLLGGYDEAILLDAEGLVAEASGENIFVVKDGIVFTPPLTSPVLAGITRDSVIRLLRELNVEVREEAFTRDSLYLADEVFFTGTAAEVTPVREVDDRPIGGGSRGPLTARIQELYGRVVRGGEAGHLEWLTFL